jgi:hypothetical protein
VIVPCAFTPEELTQQFNDPIVWQGLLTAFKDRIEHYKEQLRQKEILPAQEENIEMKEDKGAVGEQD